MTIEDSKTLGCKMCFRGVCVGGGGGGGGHKARRNAGHGKTTEEKLSE